MFDTYYPTIPDTIDLRARLPRKNLENLIVLNVGLGVGSSGLGRQLPFFPFKRLDNIDIHQPYLDGAQTKEWNAGVVNFINADVRGFDTSPYDVVLMFDVLEHLFKEESLKVMDNIKCKQIIFIPLEKEFRTNIYGAAPASKHSRYIVRF